MNTRYATLNSYNTIDTSDLSIVQYDPSKSKKKKEKEKTPSLFNDKLFILESVLEGYNMSPEILTDASAVLTMVYDPSKNGFQVSLKIRKIKHMVACQLFMLNNHDEKDKYIMTLWENKNIKDTTSMNLIIDFIPFLPKKTGMTWPVLLEMIIKQKIIVSISTEKNPEGEIDGVLNVLY
jgi:hypothetical protein